MDHNQTQQKSNPARSPHGTPWQFRYVIIVITVSVLVIVAKALGLF